MKNNFYLITERHGLLLAVLIHLTAAEIFIFSFPIKGVAHKPSFVFLGAFLDPIDENLSHANYDFRFDQHLQVNVTPNINPVPRSLKPRAEFKKPDGKQSVKTTFLATDTKEGPTRRRDTDPALESTKIRIQMLKISADTYDND
ncbi:MAG: hypothetical protein AB1650_00075 [Candidatus Omnitrophota bacterium]